MTASAAFRRKFAKFRKAPKRFLSDSDSPALRALGALVPEVSPFAAVRAQRPDVSNPRAAIEKSGLFDAKFYEKKYPDVRKRGGDALSHYLKYGVQEGRAPNPLFDAYYYARQAGIHVRDQPLLHYVTVGERRGLRPHSRFDPVAYRARYTDIADSTFGVLEHYLKLGQSEGRRTQAASSAVPGDVRHEQDLRALSITILVPVFNGFQHVRRCIEAVLQHTHLPDVDLLLIDDASTDLHTRTLLEDYARLPRITLLRNGKNPRFHAHRQQRPGACRGARCGAVE